MLSKRIVAIAADKAFARKLASGLMAAGGTVETAGSLEELARGEISADLVVLHVTENDKGLVAAANERMKKEASIIAVLDRSSLEQVVDVMKAGRVAAVLVADQMKPHNLAATATRMLYGDVFGLEKTMPWGAKIYSTLVGDYQEKSICIGAVSDFATAMGVRRKYRESVEQCLDELLMNALYDAPVDSDGKQLFADVPTKTRISLRMEQKAVVQYACEGDVFALSVRDSFGALAPDTVVKYIDKCLHADQQIDRKTGGAGLGLYIISNAATQFLINVYPGVATEVICTFDLTAPKVQLKEFGVFYERIDSSGRLVAGPSRLMATPQPRPGTAHGQPPPLAAPTSRALTLGLSSAFVLLLALIGIVAYPRIAVKTGAMAVSSTPPGALIEIDGRAVGATTSGKLSVDELRLGQKYKVTARLDGYDTAEVIAEPGRGEGTSVTFRLNARASPVILESDPPGATVLVGDKEVGTSPITLTDLPSGSEQQLTLRKVGYADLIRTVKVGAPGREVSVSWSMSISPDFGSVRIESDPPGAQIYQNGELLAGVTTPVKEMILQAGKPHTILLKVAGFQPMPLAVMLEPGERGRKLDAKMVVGGGLTVTTTVKDVRVTVVGVPACTDKPAPLTDCPLAPGKYRVKLQAQKPYVSEELDVVVAEVDVIKKVPLGIIEATGDGIALQVPGGRKLTQRVALLEGKRTVTLVNVKTGESFTKQVNVTAGEVVFATP